jgi:hypothetical protein
MEEWRNKMADFLEKMREGLGKGVSTLGTKSKELLDSNRVKSQISDLERQKKEHLVELGTAVCLMLDEENLVPELLKTKRKAITEIDRQIEIKEEELAQIHAQAQQAMGAAKPAPVCTCGTAIPQGSKFCNNCGRKVEAAGASA